MAGPLTAEGALRRGEHAAVAGAVLGASALAWFFTVRMCRLPEGCCAPSLGGGPWGPAEVGGAFAMWAVMMAGMMLPTALPVTLALAAASRGRGGEGRPLLPVGAFAGGYLAVWSLYSLVAAGAQWLLQRGAWLSPRALALGPLAGGVLLVAAGAFQWSPWKDACMMKCRSPLGFLLSCWRPGASGAFAMGVRYGGYCVGCCWLLMALSFALGIMNLLWMAAVTLLMVAEKAAPFGPAVTRVAGLALAAWGVGLVAGALP